MIEFTEERKGYNKEQVRQYIESLEKEYENLSGELEAEKEKNAGFQLKIEEKEEQMKSFERLREKVQEEKKRLIKENTRLTERLEMMEMSDKPSYSEAIASALVAAEIQAKQIVENAENRAELINEGATRDLSDIIKVKMDVLAQVRILADKLTDVINTEEEVRDQTAYIEMDMADSREDNY